MAASHLPSSLHDPAPAPLSQDPSRKQPERQHALAARAAHCAEAAVSCCTSALPPPSCGKIGGRGPRAWRLSGV